MVPVFTHVLRWGGAVDASRSSVEATLQAGESIGVNPGGIAEMFWTYPQPGCLPDEEYAVVKSRKGFVRLAVKYGANLVPVFVFGGSQLFRLLPVPKFLETISRRLKTSLLLFYGRFGLPIPFRVPMLYAVGSTITTRAQPTPTPEEVDFVHNIFMRELERTFEAHKDQYGWSHKKLVLVWSAIMSGDIWWVIDIR
jgi:diacylglycerol O-acyltransferase 2, plant